MEDRKVKEKEVEEKNGYYKTISYKGERRLRLRLRRRIKKGSNFEMNGYDGQSRRKGLGDFVVKLQLQDLTSKS